MTPNVCKMFTNSPSTLTFCPYLSWLNSLFMANFQLNSMSSYAKNKLQMCSVTQHQCRRCQMCGKCSHINSLHSRLDCYKKWLVFIEQSVMAKFQLISMSSYATNKLQMCSVTQHQCRRPQMCEKCSQIHPVHSLFVRYKNDLSWLNNLFVARFQLISMSSYATNKLQMCSVTQHQCRRPQMCGKCSQIHPVHSLFVRYKNDLSWLNNLLFVRYKNDLSWLNNLFVARFQLISMSSYANNKLQMCSVTQHQCRWRQLTRQTCSTNISIQSTALLRPHYLFLLLVLHLSLLSPSKRMKSSPFSHLLTHQKPWVVIKLAQNYWSPVRPHYVFLCLYYSNVASI